jgi:hypothetical protein
MHGRLLEAGAWLYAKIPFLAVHVQNQAVYISLKERFIEMAGKAFVVGLLWLMLAVSPAPGQSTDDADYLQGRGESSGWGTNAAVRQRPEGGSGGIKKVRIGRHAGYDRVVFEFDNDEPNYWVHYEPPPISFMSGEEVKGIRGRAFIEISLSPVLYSEKNYNTPAAPIKNGRSPLRTSLISDVWSIGWFEGEMRYVLGLKERRPFRVQMFSNPSRLVIDLKR